MSAKKYVVDLSEEDRHTLEWFISTGERKAEDNGRARILLKADDVLTDSEISEHVGCHPKTVFNTRKVYTERGLAAMNRRKPDREYDRKLDGRAEARLSRLACSEPPDGHARWTLHLLADELVTLDGIDFESISHEAVRQRLKNTLKPHLSDYWAIPPEQDANFVYYMEDVLVSTTNHTTRTDQSSASMNPVRHFVATNATRSRRNRERSLASTLDVYNVTLDSC